MRRSLKKRQVLDRTQIRPYSFPHTAHPTPKSCTNRKILATIAKLLDPTGWLDPLVVLAKIVIQQIQSDGAICNQPINSLPISKWKAFVRIHRHIENVKIPGWATFTNEAPFQIHSRTFHKLLLGMKSQNFVVAQMKHLQKAKNIV